jgi:hypothetical protein
MTKDKVGDENIWIILVYFAIKNYMLILNMIQSNFLKLWINRSIVAGFLCGWYLFRLHITFNFLNCRFVSLEKEDMRTHCNDLNYKTIQSQYLCWLLWVSIGCDLSVTFCTSNWSSSS